MEYLVFIYCNYTDQLKWLNGSQIDRNFGKVEIRGRGSLDRCLRVQVIGSRLELVLGSCNYIATVVCRQTMTSLSDHWSDCLAMLGIAVGILGLLFSIIGLAIQFRCYCACSLRYRAAIRDNRQMIRTSLPKVDSPICKSFSAVKV